MKMRLWVALVLVLSCYSYYCNAELLEEGTTTSTEIISSDGEITETQETTTTVEHKSTGNIIHNDGNQNTDVGGIGSAKTWANCPIEGLGTGACSELTSGTLTTYQEYIQLNSFEIKSGGQIDWSVSAYMHENDTMYFESRLYNDNSLLQTDIINLQNQLSVQLYEGSINFDDAIDKVFVSIGGVDANAYSTLGGFFDDLTYNITYNYITTSIENFIDIVQPTIAANEIYSIDTYTVDTVTIDPPLVDVFVVEDFDTPEIEVFEETMIELPVIETEIIEPEIVEQIEEIFTEVEIEPVVEDTPEIVAEVENEEIKTATNEAPEPKEEVKVETPTKEVKPTSESKKQQENDKPSKQEKANRIMQTFNNIYSEEAQQTQLFLIMALGTNFKTYEQKNYVPQIEFYKEQYIQDNLVIEDFYGDYFSVGNSLTFNRMVDAQYE